jgi:hypothetical protein
MGAEAGNEIGIGMSSYVWEVPRANNVGLDLMAKMAGTSYQF